METLLEGEAEQLTRVAIGRALAGDPLALKLCLQRLLAPLRSRTIEFDLPPGDGSIATVAERLDATLAAVASGEITPDEAESLARLLQEQRHQIETADIDNRIAKLERWMDEMDQADKAAAARAAAPGGGTQRSY